MLSRKSFLVALLFVGLAGLDAADWHSGESWLLSASGLVKDLQCEFLCIRRSDQPAAVQVIFCLGVQQATSQKPGPSPTLQSSTLHAGSLSASLQQTHISRSTSRH
jgi:hypothetical protein